MGNKCALNEWIHRIILFKCISSFLFAEKKSTMCIYISNFVCAGQKIDKWNLLLSKESVFIVKLQNQGNWEVCLWKKIVLNNVLPGTYSCCSLCVWYCFHFHPGHWAMWNLLSYEPYYLQYTDCLIWRLICNILNLSFILHPAE